MKLVIEPGVLRGTLRAIPSKSDAHRQLILSALADAPTRLLMGALSEDIEATIRCLMALGARIERDDQGVTVQPIARNGWSARDLRACPSGSNHGDRPASLTSDFGESASPSSITLDCGESGSLLRFLMPLVAALGMNVRFVTHGRLTDRPNAALISALRSHGVSIDADTPPFRLSGKLTPGVFELPGDVSSQYASGLLMALPRLYAPSEIVFTSPVQSQGYIELTLEVMGRYGVVAERTAHGYRVPAPQHIKSPGQIEVEGDWSNAAFFLSTNALGGDVRVSGLNPDSAQADRAILRLIEQMGAARDDSITIDASEIPDLVPILSVIATQTQRETRIVNAARLRMKESDRLATMREGLCALGADVCEQPDALIIRGGGRLRGGEVWGHNDHRIVMAMAMAGAVADAPVTIHGADAVAKSYPGFFEDFARLGECVHE